MAVRNRTQDEIDSGLSFDEARVREEEYFSSHSELADLPSHYKGTKQVALQRIFYVLNFSYLMLQLAMKLTEIQIERIRSILPKVRETIGERLRSQRREQSLLPLELSSSVDCAQRCVWCIIINLKQFSY